MDQLKQELATLAKQMQAILEGAEDGNLSEEQAAEYDKLEAAFDAKKAELDTQRAAAERKRRQEERLKEVGQLSPNPRQSSPDNLVDGGNNGNGNGRIVIKEKRFDSLGEQLQAIANVAISGQENDMLRWEQLAVATGGAAAGVPSDGGYLIQKDFASELFSRMSSAGSLSDPRIPQVRNIPLGPNSDGLKLTVVDETSRATGSRWGGVQVYWGAEGDSATAKKPKLRQMELELKELIGLAYATNRLMQDASALEAVFLQAFSEEMSWMKEDARINGTGAGQPKGITSTTGASATISVAKETGQAAATVVYENIVKMWARLWSRSRLNSVWLINQDVEPSLMQMTLSVGTGGVPVYLPPGGASASPYGMLMGRPVVPVEYCATLGTVGDIILWDPTQYVEITKGGMSADQSVHVRFITNENTFRFITRVDGQPLWNSALTPANGSNSQSPQIVLATRA